MEETNKITEGVIWKQLLLFFFPIVFGTFFQQIYNTADTIVVGRFVGKEALAAVGGSVTQITNLIVGFFVGLSAGAAVIISQFYGANDEKNLKKTLHTAYAFSLVAGIAIGVLGILVSGRLLILMKTPEEIVDASRIYLQIYFAGLVFNLIYNMGSSILRAVGDSRRPLYVLMITCGMNIILDIVFVVVFHMGVAGAAFATIFSQAVSAVTVTWMLMRSRSIYRLRLRSIRCEGSSLRSMLRIGIPAGMESVMYNIANLVIQVFVNNLGTDTVAAWGTFGKIDAVYWMVTNAFAISITTFVGQNYGAGKIGRMRKSVRVSMLMSFGCAIVLSAVLVAGSHSLYSLFTTDANVVRIGTDMMHFLVPSYSLYVIIDILSGALRGAGRVLVPMLLTCGGVCGLRMVWMFLVLPHFPGMHTIMLSYPASWGITAILFIIYYFMRFPREERAQTVRR